MRQPELAGKITGCLLESPIEQIQHLNSDDAMLKIKIDEAVKVILQSAAAKDTLDQQLIQLVQRQSER